MTDSMIAFLPGEADWVKQDLPHMTLVYTGPIENAESGLFERLIKNTSMISTLMAPFRLSAIGVEQFGEGGEQVDVLRLRPTPQLSASRLMVESLSKSQYPDFNPHVTIGPVGSAVPELMPEGVYFNRMVMAWGEDQYLFNLNNSY